MSSPATDATTPVPVVPSSPVSGSVPDDEAAERGSLHIGFGVVRRIAEHAADSTDGTMRTQRRVVGLGLGEAGASAKISGYGDQVDVRLEVPLAYPAPIALTVEAVRGNVRERVQTLTGYAVRSLDVTVSALTSPAGAPAPTSRVE
ncbi:Asp23/Gls24 family envelope stress response protein [Actinomycetospora sp. OC33-EN08]|uniref:Asp23/Gls24 family envelope stress response protein n=1 Tax=Actinomycetospora aurantiaca TaxID=3129233 RepID=A0ABU8MT97_9PSEU